jgi:hypothetical protein
MPPKRVRQIKKGAIFSDEKKDGPNLFLIILVSEVSW